MLLVSNVWKTYSVYHIRAQTFYWTRISALQTNATVDLSFILSAAKKSYRSYVQKNQNLKNVRLFGCCL